MLKHNKRNNCLRERNFRKYRFYDKKLKCTPVLPECYYYGGTRRDPLNLASILENPEKCQEQYLQEEKQFLPEEKTENIETPLPFKASKRDPLGLKSNKQLSLKRKYEEESTFDSNKISPKRSKVEPTKSVKGQKRKFQFGNYPSYYGYRLPGRDPLYFIDPRLSVIPQIWFNGKSILDIGCNSGFISLWISRFFSPFKILACDIDTSLVTAAKRNLRFLNKPKLERKAKILWDENSANDQNSLEPHENVVETDAKSQPFPKNIYFYQCDYAQDHELNEENGALYDIILCLSVTKWIQLNNGDEGLKRVFKRMHHELKPGGRLILEPQPYSSYRKKKNISEITKKHFSEMKLKPEEFPEYLLSAEIGFESMKILPRPHFQFPSASFNRIMYCFRKTQIPTAKPPENLNGCLELASSPQNIFSPSFNPADYNTPPEIN